MKPLILIVDDEEDLRELLVMELEENDMDCVEASNIIEAQEIFDNKKIDLIITDVNMPKGTGFELIENVRKKPSDVPVILLLTDPSPEDEVRVKDFKVNLVLSKPFDLLEVAQTIKKLSTTSLKST